MITIPAGWTQCVTTMEGSLQFRHDETGKMARVSHLHVKVSGDECLPGEVNRAIAKAEIEIERERNVA